MRSRATVGTNVLGHSQSSLRDWSRWECVPEDRRPGLLSAVPSGLIAIRPDR